MKRINYTNIQLTCLTMVIFHDLDKRSMVNNDLARLTIILASVACLRSLGWLAFNQSDISVSLQIET